MLKAKNPKLESSGYIDKPQIGRIVFKAVRDALNQEAVKVVEELEKQLTAIIGSLDSKDTGAAHYSTKCSNDDAYCKIKRDIKQLFIYLQRVLMLNVTQDLCKQLTREFDEWMKTIGRSKVERQQPEQKAVDYEKSIHDLSDKTPEYEIELGRCEEVQCDMNDGYENLNEHVKSLFESTHNVTDLLEYVSRKFLEVKEENRKLKGVA